VVLGVVVHLPVEKAEKGMEQEGAAAKAEVGDIILHADVLGIITQEKKPAAISGRRADEDGHDPVTGGEGDKQDGGMTCQEAVRPAALPIIV
jgi:hypothetical protein